MAIFCVTYDYDPGATETLDEVRPAHRDWLAEQPQLLASGPTDAGGAVLIWEGGSAAEVEAILDRDPFHDAGVSPGAAWSGGRSSAAAGGSRSVWADSSDQPALLGQNWCFSGEASGQQRQFPR